MKVNEIFYSIQGEGFWTGTASVFIRFSGCNQSCDFCDTEFSSYNDLSIDEIMYDVGRYGCKRVVLTGGEPCLQLDTRMGKDFLFTLRNAGYYVQIETNGSVDIGHLVYAVDWITVSRKKLPVVLERLDEVKRVYSGEDMMNLDAVESRAKHFFVQPKDTGDADENASIMKKTIEFVKRNPKWRISLQTHKVLNVR